MEKSISTFFPVLNEERTVEKLTLDLLQLLMPLFQDLEVIIINDGSTDKTGEIAEELCRNNDGYVRAIHHDRSKGYGKALKAGFDAARYDLIFFTDGDYQFDMNDLYRALPLADNFDLVVGYRQYRKDPRYRILLSRGYNLLVWCLFGLRLTDIDCSFKLFKRAAVETINIESDGYFVDTEIIVKSKKKGLRIKEIPVRHLPRAYGESKVRFKHIFVTLCEILKLWKKLH